jgi:putative Ig domain-containing protein
MSARVRMVAVLAAVALVAGTAPAAPAAAAGVDDLPFASAVFLSTHNSFSGNLFGGTRGSIQQQLDAGVRFVELDIHDDNFASIGDYQVGHSDGPGSEVDPTGNPQSIALRPWLHVIADWSFAHPTHAPLVVMLDVKDDLTDNTSFAAGNMTALNSDLRSEFGSHLLLAKDYPSGLPAIGALRGRVIPLLSGDAGNARTEYRRDLGFNPAVAINGSGQVVEVHDSGAGVLWYWTGSYGADGQVTWLRHGRYDTGRTPAVALNDAGWLVEVHQAPGDPSLWSHVAHLDADGEITWSSAARYDSGIAPTVMFTSPAGNTVREVHRNPDGTQNWTWNGVLNTSTWSLAWSGNATTSDPLYPKATATRDTSRVSVFTAPDHATPNQTLQYSTNTVGLARITYEQVMFVEYQQGDSEELLEGAIFYAATASETTFLAQARRDGHVVRAWDFDSLTEATSPLANYPATNQLFCPTPPTSGCDWYQSFMGQQSNLVTDRIPALDATSFPDQTTKVGVSFTGQLTATGGTPPYSWTAINLPGGVTVDPSSGLISGMPVVVGQFDVGYTVQDSQGLTSGKTFSWTVNERENRLFTGTATASKPTTALSLASSRAQSAATADGFGFCELADSSADLNEFGSYDAWATLSCFR